MTNIDLMNYWINSSNNDFETMKLLFEGGKYTWSLFVGHLVIEKLLKALYAKMNEKAPHAPKSHDLSYLVTKIPLEIDNEKEILLDTITRFNLDGRYDDYKNNFYNLCTIDYTRESIEKIISVRNWLLELITLDNVKESDGEENEEN